MYKLYFRFINNLNYNIIFLITEIIKKLLKSILIIEIKDKIKTDE